MIVGFRSGNRIRRVSPDRGINSSGAGVRNLRDCRNELGEG